MRVVKITITKELAFLYLILPMLVGCSDSLDVSQGPCPFPPAESNFPVIPETHNCEECYFNIEFRGEKYSFATNQFDTATLPVGQTTDTTILATTAWNSFLSFYFVEPSSVEQLYNSIGVKTPLLKVDTVPGSKFESFPPQVSAALGIFNYCEKLFKPITDDVSQSYHQLTEVKLIKSYPFENDSEPYQFNHFYAYGELEMIFQINGELQEATASYKIDLIFYEKL